MSESAPADMDDVICPYCREIVRRGALKCKHCGEYFVSSGHSDVLAGCFGLLFGPVGLWYKGQWAAGFAWMAMAVLLGIVSGGLLFPIFWLGMAIHAAAAEGKR